MTQGNKCLGTILFLSVKCQDFILKILLTRHFGPTPNFSENRNMVKMAAGKGSGHGSPTSHTRSLEKVFEDAQYSGEIHLCNRKLKEYPKISSKFDLADTSAAGNLLFNGLTCHTDTMTALTVS